MKNLTTTIFVFIMLFAGQVFGQKIEGIVFDQETNAPLWGASVRVQGSQRRGGGTLGRSPGRAVGVEEPLEGSRAEGLEEGGRAGRWERFDPDRFAPARAAAHPTKCEL